MTDRREMNSIFLVFILSLSIDKFFLLKFLLKFCFVLDFKTVPLILVF